MIKIDYLDTFALVDSGVIVASKRNDSDLIIERSLLFLNKLFPYILRQLFYIERSYSHLNRVSDVDDFHRSYVALLIE